MKFFAALVIGIFGFSSALWAQTKPYPYRAQITGEETHIYEKADFDSRIIMTLTPGATYDVSQNIYGGAFYRIRIRPGLLGYVSDADVKPLWKGTGAGTSTNAAIENPPAKEKLADAKVDPKKEKSKKKAKTDKRKRPFEYTQFVGLQYASIEYQEETMGDRRREASGFFGVKLSGPDLIVDGAFPTEVNFLYHAGAPSYYEKLTGNGADGWIFLMNFLWESYFPHGKNALTFLGFGPMFRYSKFNASITDSTTGKVTSYSLEDMGAGAVFNAGISVRIDQVALRGEAQYYWEKQPYWGAALALQMSF